jgi:hypothetical protein
VDAPAISACNASSDDILVNDPGITNFAGCCLLICHYYFDCGIVIPNLVSRDFHVFWFRLWQIFFLNSPLIAGFVSADDLSSGQNIIQFPVVTY